MPLAHGRFTKDVISILYLLRQRLVSAFLRWPTSQRPLYGVIMSLAGHPAPLGPNPARFIDYRNLTKLIIGIEYFQVVSQKVQNFSEIIKAVFGSVWPPHPPSQFVLTKIPGSWMVCIPSYVPLGVGGSSPVPSERFLVRGNAWPWFSAGLSPAKGRLGGLA